MTKQRPKVAHKRQSYARSMPAGVAGMAAQNHPYIRSKGLRRFARPPHDVLVSIGQGDSARKELMGGTPPRFTVKNAVEHLSEYAAYHRDKRNIAIHGAGIPLIVLSIVILTSRVGLHIGQSVTITLAEVLLLALVAFYLTLERTLGIAFGLVGLVMVLVGNSIAPEPTGVWIGAGIGTFVFGWILQFIGHGWEGKKPAFLDDIMGLLIGPLFVTAEAFFAAGQLPQLKAAIEERAGATYIRTSTAKA